MKKNLLSICRWFRKSTRDRRPRRTPGQPFRCPSVPDPPQGAGQPSDFCTGSLSFPTVHLFSGGGIMTSLVFSVHIKVFCEDLPSSRPRWPCSGDGRFPALAALGRSNLGGQAPSSKGRSSGLCRPPYSCSEPWCSDAPLLREAGAASAELPPRSPALLRVHNGTAQRSLVIIGIDNQVILSHNVLLWFRHSCPFQTRQACWSWDWILSTRISWEQWLDWQRGRFHHFPCYKRPWWRPWCCLHLDRSSTRLECDGWWFWSLTIRSRDREEEERSVTAVLVRVAAPDVLAGFGRVCSASVRTAQVWQMPPELLQRGVDSSVCTESSLLPVGSSLIFDHLWSCWWDSCSRVVCKFQRFWNITIPLVVICSNKEAFSRCAWRTWGSWGSRGSGLSFWTLTDRRWMLDSFDP